MYVSGSSRRAPPPARSIRVACEALPKKGGVQFFEGVAPLTLGLWEGCLGGEGRKMWKRRLIKNSCHVALRTTKGMPGYTVASEYDTH